MSILKILQYPDSRLRNKGYKVKNVKDPTIQKIIKDMTETLLATKNCAGLSATQLDIDTPPNITVINHNSNDNEKSDVLCLINPEVIESSGNAVEKEGCMSIAPEVVSAKVKRATKIKVKALNKNGDPIEIEAVNFLAKCIQHECDHLLGILYIDYLSKLTRSFIDKKITKLQHKTTTR